MTRITITFSTFHELMDVIRAFVAASGWRGEGGYVGHNGRVKATWGAGEPGDAG